MTNKKQPFAVEHIREFGDGSCLLKAVNIKPGFTTGDLIDYVLTRKGEAGYIHPANNTNPVLRAEYSNGKLLNPFIIPNREIKRLEIYGGYHRWDYIFEI